MSVTRCMLYVPASEPASSRSRSPPDARALSFREIGRRHFHPARPQRNAGRDSVNSKSDGRGLWRAGRYRSEEGSRDGVRQRDDGGASGSVAESRLRVCSRCSGPCQCTAAEHPTMPWSDHITIDRTVSPPADSVARPGPAMPWLDVSRPSPLSL